MAPPTATGASSSQRGEVRAADEFQAPSFGRSEYQQSTSPFFTDKESAEALQWARSPDGALQMQEDEGDAGTHATLGEGQSGGTAVMDEPLSPTEERGAIHIGGRRRRDSQMSSYDGAGSVFDGPSAGAVPSSVTR